MKITDLTSLSDYQLIDVRLSEDFEAAHLAEARNNCVFEMDFINRLSNTAPDPKKTTVVYGANEQTHEADIAAEKLRRHGFDDVKILKGGLAAADQMGVEIIYGDPLPKDPALPDGNYQINLEESKVEWLGRNLLNKHWGTAALSSGNFTLSNENLIEGNFVIDLTTLECTDLAGTGMHDVLISHLQNDDFFDVKNYPKATFKVTQASTKPKPTPGSVNTTITGDLTLRGQTHPITLDAATGVTAEGYLAMQASFSIDRTQWGILYGSGKYFHRLAGHVVNDLLEFQLRIVSE